MPVNGLLDNIEKVHQADFAVIVYNFLDMLSHARTETQIIRDLAEDEAAFRSLTRSWFEHSDLLLLLKLLAERGHTVILSSDHGTIRVDNPVKVVGDPGDFAEPALQNREKPGLQSQGGIRHYEAGTGSPAQIQYHVDLYLRLQP